MGWLDFILQIEINNKISKYKVKVLAENPSNVSFEIAGKNGSIVIEHAPPGAPGMGETFTGTWRVTRGTLHAAYQQLFFVALQQQLTLGLPLQPPKPNRKRLF